MTGPCCVKPNGWWDWNLGPVSCDQGEDQLMIFTSNANGGGGSVQMKADDKSTVPRCWSLWDFPVGGYEVQMWAKPLPDGAAALYILNTNTTSTKTGSVALSKVLHWPTAEQPQSTGSLKVRDIWGHNDNGTVSAAGEFKYSVGPADSAFVLLTPA